MKKLMNLFFLLLGMVSCDTREDWFEKNSEFPDIEIGINGKLDTIRQGDLRKIVVNLNTVRNDRGVLFTDTLYVRIRGIDNKGSYPMKAVNLEGLTIKGGRKFEIGEDNALCLKLFDIYICDEFVLFNSDSLAFLLATYSGHAKTFDIFGNDQSYTVEVNVYGPVPVTPIIKVEKLIDNYEYKLSMSKRSELGGKIAKYEWCIDGNIVPYKIADNRLEGEKGNWQSGKAAYGGTYITATTLSSVNHSFQTTGEHTVYYRCMDDMGIWSMWYSEKINVE
ncbi:MAG: hypothetical protein MJY63_04965 [Paludibacteraceae bacterium]|nr:hypothetical protein [Paludibacteraceae bacterium]